MSRHSPLQHRVACNTAEVSVLAGLVKTLADEFFGVESSQPALRSVQYQIPQTVCFCHNSLSDHLEFIFHFSDLSISSSSSSSYSAPTVGAHSPTALACAKVIAETYTLGLDSCEVQRSFKLPHVNGCGLHYEDAGRPPMHIAAFLLPLACCQDFILKTNTTQ